MRALAFGLGQNPKTETQPPQYDSRRPAPTFRLYQAMAASSFAATYRHELRRGPVRSDLDALGLLLTFDAAHHPCDVERHGMYGHISAQSLDKLHASLWMRLRRVR